MVWPAHGLVYSPPGLLNTTSGPALYGHVTCSQYGKEKTEYPKDEQFETVWYRHTIHDQTYQVDVTS